MVSRWIWSFAFTQLIEVPIYLRALSGPDRTPRLPWPQRLGLSFLASALTHPYVWFVFFGVFYSRAYDDLGYRWPSLIEHRYTIYFFVAEGFAVGVEALLLRGCGLQRALLWALLANGTSAGLGFLSRHYIGWPG